MKTVWVVEAIAHRDGERDVSAVFSTREKAMDYIMREHADKDLIEVLGEYNYYVSQHDIDRWDKEL